MGPNTQRRDCVWHILEPGDTISGNSEMVLIWKRLIEVIIRPFLSLIFHTYRRTTQLNFNVTCTFSERVYGKQ